MAFGGTQPTDDSLGLQIKNLKRGDQVIVLMGDGDPKSERDTIDIVWKVSRSIAITASGIVLSPETITRLVKTGGHYEDFLASESAKDAWQRVQASLPEDDVTSEPE